MIGDIKQLSTDNPKFVDSALLDRLFSKPAKPSSPQVRCRDCKFWEKGYTRLGFCTNDKLHARDTDTQDEWTDGLAGGKLILTGADFGCIHSEPK